MLQCLSQQKIKLNHFSCLHFFSANALLNLKKKKKTLYLCSHLRRKALKFRYSSVCVSRSVVSDSLRSYGLYLTRLLCPWDSPGKSTGVGGHFLLQ